MTIERRWRARWETGPDAGSTWLLGSGRYVIGRAPQADLRTADPAMEPFHAQLQLGGESPVIRQLAGRLPLRCEHADAGDAWRAHVGHSTLHVSTAADADEHVRPPARSGRKVVRTPRRVPAWTPSPVRVEPEPAPPMRPTGGLLPALAGLAATVVIALVVRQPMFVMFGAVGTVAALAHWGAGRIRHRREMSLHRRMLAEARERARCAVAEQAVEWVAHLARSVPTLADACDRLSSGAGLWQRRPADGDAWIVSLGLGAVSWSPVVDGDRDRVPAGPPVGELPVAVDLAPGTRLSIGGPNGVALANALIVQLAACTGPADWQLVVVTTNPELWAWTRHLPHARDALGQHLAVSEDELLALLRDGSLAGRHTVVVTDQSSALSVRTSGLRRMEATHDSLALVVVHDGPAPAVCRSSVVTTSAARARYVADVATGVAPVHLRLTGLPARSAEHWALELREARDPEDVRAIDADIPSTIELGELLADVGIEHTDPESIAAAWRRAGNDPSPVSRLGRAADGVVEVDLVRDGPHGLLAGTTGSGKSELLRSLVLGLSCMLGPQHLTFVLIDYKGGAAFDELSGLPHVVGTVTDLDEQLAERALRSLRAELASREQLLRQHGANDLTAVRALLGAPVLPRVLVVVDEFAALASEQAEFLHALVGIAQRGRSLGVHLLLGTQRPSGVISDDIRANTSLRVALRLHDASDALDVVGDAAPASLPRALPGRAVMRLGPDELVTFQTARVSDAPAMVSAIRDAAALSHTEQPRPVWCEPLPERAERAHAEALEPGAGRDPRIVGIVDLPDQQARAVLRWSRADGSVIVVGSPGSGVTSSLITLATSVLDERHPAATSRRGHDDALFVIDAGNDPRWDAVAAHPRCAGIVRLHERERVWRLLHRVAEGGAGACLVVDGLGALRHELDCLERMAELELLDRVLTSTDAVALVGADRAGGVPASVSSRCAIRIVLHLHDPHDAVLLGVPAASVPPRIAGRAVVGGSAVQLIAPRGLRAAAGRSRVPGIDTLPAEIVAATLPPAMHVDGRWRVPVGVRFADLKPATLDVCDGDHVLVAGPARSGRSSAAHLLCRSWLASDPAATAVVVAGTRSPLRTWLADRSGLVHDGLETAIVAIERDLAVGHRVMLVVDDAELVDDPSGRLASMIGARTPGLVVVAAARPDALRQSYGHWTAAVRRSRLGLLATGGTDIDGDLLGAALPRRPLLPARPGLVHLVDGGDVELVQLAQPSGESADRQRTHVS